MRFIRRRWVIVREEARRGGGGRWLLACVLALLTYGLITAADAAAPLQRIWYKRSRRAMNRKWNNNFFTDVSFALQGHCHIAFG
jgi:hypothetical protein